MREISEQAQYIKVKKGARIINKGDEATCTYMIITGSVNIFIEKGSRKIELATLSEDEIFGETACIPGSTYGASAEANEDCELMKITPESLGALINSSDPIIRALILMLMQRLKKANSALVKSESREFMDIDLI